MSSDCELNMLVTIPRKTVSRNTNSTIAVPADTFQPQEEPVPRPAKIQKTSIIIKSFIYALINFMMTV